ncbi:MAG: GNAT family N-acetyltransferase [Candidatus Nealsonbacteria bacterium]
MRIEQLTEQRLQEAINLVDMVFPEQGDEPARIVFSASLNPEKYKEYLMKHQILPDLRYWLAIDELGEVRGIIGLYRYEKDKEEAFWGGWFCVDPRKKGIGLQLGRFAINEARRRGKAFLRLWTTTSLDELRAHKLYDKSEFKLVGEEPFGNTGLMKLFYELKL